MKKPIMNNDFLEQKELKENEFTDEDEKARTERKQVKDDIFETFTLK